MSRPTVLIVGAGIYGATAALELQRRGHHVTLLDGGPIPHPDAASTDISKVIRMEYGPDEGYMALAEEAVEGWEDWNDQWTNNGTGPLYHETGILMVSREPMVPGGFEFESWQLLNGRGHQPERMDAGSLGRRFGAWSTGNHVDGFYHPRGGFAESSRVVEAVIQWGVREGVTVRGTVRATRLLEEGGRVVGVVADDGEELRADDTLLTTGAWIGKLLPEVDGAIRPTGHPVVHYRPLDPEGFLADRFPVFTADIARTGFYGFPLSRDGVVKIATHSIGSVTDPDGLREVTDDDIEHQRVFLRETFPGLAEAPVAATRLCLYADTPDGDFWIDRHPSIDGLSVAGGGSGHGFKFAPVLGELIADAVEATTNPWLERFRWRQNLDTDRSEAARHWGR